jgi:metal-responsive CopG/Arc/MetJ family transcriptional regulator
MAKVMVSLPDDLLHEIDAAAQHRSTSRSAFLAAAARRELMRRDPEAMSAAISRSERRFEQSGAFDSAEIVRADRDARR